ncbi:MAG: cupredoxin domain-containing protein [Chloroflexi bacterium]|nr:cupredoxin domain-containing protein [Chloroflexota bacterium]
MVPRLPAAGLALAVTIVLAACGEGTSPAPSSGPSSAPSSEPSQGGPVACEPAAADADFGGTVTIKDFTMSPGTVSIRAGEAVAWTNQDAASHTATLDDVDCSTDSIANGVTAKLLFNVAGTYTYHCRIHPGTMMGFTVEVSP